MNMQMLFSDSKYFARGTIETGIVRFDNLQLDEYKNSPIKNLFGLHLQAFAILQTFLNSERYRFEVEIRDIDEEPKTPEAQRADLMYSLSGKIIGRNTQVFHFFTKLSDYKPEVERNEAQKNFKALINHCPENSIFEIRIYKVRKNIYSSDQEN